VITRLAQDGSVLDNGFVARLRPDGSVAFATSSGFGFGLGSVFALDSFAELPTTGGIAGGSAVSFTGDAPANVPSSALVGFDAGGRVLWASRYTFGAAPRFFSSGKVGVQLTDDGGIFSAAFVKDPADALGGLLWAFKAFAKEARSHSLPERWKSRR
jgi:hypothetical protein